MLTDTEEDAYRQVSGGATFSLGPVSIGAQVSGEYTGEETTANTSNLYKNKLLGYHLI